VRRLILTLVMLCVASVTFAGAGSSLSSYYVIPAAAHLPGQGHTYWVTDLSIVNPYSWRSITVGIFYLPGDRDNSAGWPTVGVTLAPGAHVTYRDVVATVFGTSGKGALGLITQDGAYFTATARTYTGASGTFGQTENGQAVLAGPIQRQFLTGMENDGSFHSNVGADNLSSVTLHLQIDAFNDQGAHLGSRTLAIPPMSMSQISVSSFSSSFSSGYLVVTCVDSTPGVLWTSYATPVDNKSGDSTFVEGRVDWEYTWARPQYDMSGWWYGWLTTSSGSQNGYLYIAQDGAAVTLYALWPDGLIEAIYSGYMDGNVIYPTAYLGSSHFQCNASTFLGGQLTVSGSTISGQATMAGVSGCVNGTFSIDVQATSGSPFAMSMKAASVPTGRQAAAVRTGKTLRRLLPSLAKKLNAD